MNIWVLVAAAFSMLFTLIGLGNTNKLAAVFVFLAGLCCDVYLAYQALIPDWIRFMFMALLLFQLFVFINVLVSGGGQSRGTRRYY